MEKHELSKVEKELVRARSKEIMQLRQRMDQVHGELLSTIAEAHNVPENAVDVDMTPPDKEGRIFIQWELKPQRPELVRPPIESPNLGDEHIGESVTGTDA